MFTVNKQDEYVTRNDLPVLIYDIREEGGNSFPVHGAYFSNNIWRTMEWTLNGKFKGSDSSFDIFPKNFESLVPIGEYMVGYCDSPRNYKIIKVVKIVNKKIIGIDIGITKLVEVSVDRVMSFENFTKTFYGDLHEQY